MVLALGAVACAPDGSGPWRQAENHQWRQLPAARGSGGFASLDSDETGVTFSNHVTEEQILQNQNHLIGGGVALGDVDGDGRPDVYLGRMDGPNGLYLNRGGWRFDEAAARAGVDLPEAKTTGANLVDIEGDGDLDLLLTTLDSSLRLFVNSGSGTFEEATGAAGVQGRGAGTTTTLADVDRDGDLDLYAAHYKTRSVRDIFPPYELTFHNVVRRGRDGYHLVPPYGEHYELREEEDRLVRFEIGERDRFFQNLGGGRFAEVAFTEGRFLTEDGSRLPSVPKDWGLSARFHDLDGDGLSDLYVANDFESPDRIWINVGGLRFRALRSASLRTTSQASMAVDMSDLDRDGDVDIYVADMLARDPGRRLRQTPPVAPDEKTLGEAGERLQEPRNTLLMNRGDTTFAERARQAGVEATGWTWGVAATDVDLDGYEDLIVTTGHAYDVLDSDSYNRLSHTLTTSDWRDSRLLLPPLHLPNVAFRNRGDGTFEEVGEAWGYTAGEDVSHGLALGDLDGDGDLDVVVNRLDADALLLRNEATAPRVAVRLRGTRGNSRGIGATVWLLDGAVPVQRKEMTSGGLYLSGSQAKLAFAAGSEPMTLPMTLVVRWPDGRWSVVEGARSAREYRIVQASATRDLPDRLRRRVLRRQPPASQALFAPATGAGDSVHHHIEAEYDDARRQPLLMDKLSRLGPGVSWYDMDRDGDEDLLVGAGRGGRLALLENAGDGGFRPPAWLGRTTELDLTTVLGAPASDGQPSLVVGQMGYEAVSPAAAASAPRVLRFSTAPGVRSSGTEVVGGDPGSVGPLAMDDVEGDGDLDLFIGGRVVPAAYPRPVPSALFLRDGERLVADSANRVVLDSLGMVSAAVFTDIDQDGDADLALAVEWGPVRVLLNDGAGRFDDATDRLGLAEWTSRWNGIASGDLDGDGFPDLVATSWGTNTLLTASAERPLRLHWGDLDGNGTLDLVASRKDAITGLDRPLRSMLRIGAGLPYVPRRMGTFESYASSSTSEILGEPLSLAHTLEATTFEHTVFLNRDTRFEPWALPPEAQMAPAHGVVVADLDGDGTEDLFLSQNFFPTEEGAPRYAAGRGLVLHGAGDGTFRPLSKHESGIAMYGDQRGAASADYDADGRIDLAVGQNEGPTRIFRNVGAAPGLRVRLDGPPGNPSGIGASVRPIGPDGPGPVREVQAGSGYWSQNGAVQVFGGTVVDGLRVRWRDGFEEVRSVPAGVREVTVTRSHRVAKTDDGGS